ncbi:cytochrome b/b6 domain-containing protein [Lacisediminihabitans sp. H27-G8]|uniref:cytochrome b/b6 domain-containing protein n=1 Tax=Lacisediminihabitans sp. H27-G8 TaxID=3111909 RepID=UPI0038FC3898
MALAETMSGFRESRWFKLVWIVPVVLVGLFLLVLAARGIRASDGGQSFLRSFPGASQLPTFAPVGFPAWLAWQHGLNAFFLLFIIRSGWLVRTTKRPDAYWTRNNSGLIKTPGQPVRISLNLWMHISIDTLWLLNGVLFYVLIFSTGQWTRIIPTRWDVFPNAISAGLQYASLSWPVENGWVNYNALQVLSYFLVVFIAAPLALVTGIRMSPGLAVRFKPIDRIFPLPVARAIHYPVMVFFVAFIVVHVTLVLATGAINNLNHMYAVNNGYSWAGFWIFAASIVLMVAAWIGAKPIVLRSIAGNFGRVGR